MTTFSWKFRLFMTPTKWNPRTKNVQNNIKWIQKWTPKCADHLMFFSWKSQKSSPIRWHPPSEDRKPKMFRITSKGYRNDPRSALTILCFFFKKWKSHQTKSTPLRKTWIQENTKLGPCRSRDSESIIFDPCRSTDYEFIVLGPGRARAQNSSESQNFGVMKKSFHTEGFL